MVEVSAALLWQQSPQRFLLARRAINTPYAGYWELPGGKIEHDETPWQALVRELQEELKIAVDAGQPWRKFTYNYSQNKVRLHIFMINYWQGVITSSVHDCFYWQVLKQPLNVSPILAGNRQIFAALAELSLTY